MFKLKSPKVLEEVNRVQEKGLDLMLILLEKPTMNLMIWCSIWQHQPNKITTLKIKKISLKLLWTIRLTNSIHM